MITFTNLEKRWLEITFYLLCQHIFKNNNNQSDVIDFIQGAKWTNMFDYVKLISLITKHKLLLDTNIKPNKYELVLVYSNPNCRLRLKPSAIKTLIKDTDYKYRQQDIFHTAMHEEINPTTIYPKLTIPRIHETIYSFLLALRYTADIIKQIKF